LLIQNDKSLSTFLSISTDLQIKAKEKDVDVPEMHLGGLCLHAHEKTKG